MGGTVSWRERDVFLGLFQDALEITEKSIHINTTLLLRNGSEKQGGIRGSCRVGECFSRALAICIRYGLADSGDAEKPFRYRDVGL